MNNDNSLLLQYMERLTIALETKDVPKLWSQEQIAHWLGLSESTVANRVVSRPSFPSPTLPTGAGEGKKRWFADEVIDWARCNRGMLPKPRSKRDQSSRDAISVAVAL